MRVLSRSSALPCIAVAAAVAAALLLKGSSSSVHASLIPLPDAKPAIIALSADDFRAAAFEPREKQRLQAHFLRVESELRRRDVSPLSATQQAARRRLITYLEQYRVRGQFPRNEQVSGWRVPIFRDAHGTLCAMAYLIDRSGRANIVEEIARSRNLAYIPELADNPQLAAWLNDNGLSLEEAARIQPTYPWEVAEIRRRNKEDHYSRLTNDARLLNTLSVAVNASALSNPRRGREFGGLGLLTGLYGILLGTGRPDLDSTSIDKSARWNYLMGGLAAALGIYNLSRPTPCHHENAKDTATALKAQPLQRETLIGFVPSFGGENGAGGYLTLNTRF